MIAAIALLLPAEAGAQEAARYDRRLERAVMEIVAGRIGDIRGSLEGVRGERIVVPVADPAMPSAMGVDKPWSSFETLTLPDRR